MKQLWVALADHLARAKFTLTLAKSCLVRRLNALPGKIQMRQVERVQMNASRSAWIGGGCGLALPERFSKVSLTRSVSRQMNHELFEYLLLANN